MMARHVFPCVSCDKHTVRGGNYTTEHFSIDASIGTNILLIKCAVAIFIFELTILLNANLAKSFTNNWFLIFLKKRHLLKKYS